MFPGKNDSFSRPVPTRQDTDGDPHIPWGCVLISTTAIWRPPEGIPQPFFPPPPPPPLSVMLREINWSRERRAMHRVSSTGSTARLPAARWLHWELKKNSCLMCNAVCLSGLEAARGERVASVTWRCCCDVIVARVDGTCQQVDAYSVISKVI